MSVFVRVFQRFAVAFQLLAAAAPVSAADWGLTLFLLSEPPLGNEAGPISYAPGQRAVMRLMFENRGETQLENIRVEVSLTGAAPVAHATDVWKRDGNAIRATIAVLLPGDTIELPLVVELADGTERGARGTGGRARIRAGVPTSGETLVAEAYWPIASCADAYHAALRKVRYEEFDRLRAAVDASREPDGELPGGAVIAYRAEKGGDEAAAIRFAEQIARSRGLDGYYGMDDVVWVSGRLIADIGAYLGQDRYPGLCTGVAEWTGVLRDFVGRFTRRADETTSFRAGMEPAARQAVAAAGEAGVDQGSSVVEAWPEAAALFASIAGAGAPPQGVAIFAAAGDAIDAAGDTLPAERRAALKKAFGSLERLWYLELAEGRAKAVAEGFTGTLDAIRNAHAATCTCAP